jgi:hypothetical protein
LLQMQMQRRVGKLRVCTVLGRRGTRRLVVSRKRGEAEAASNNKRLASQNAS